MSTGILEDNLNRVHIHEQLKEIASETTNSIIAADCIEGLKAVAAFAAESIIYTTNGYARFLELVRGVSQGSIIAVGLLNFRRKLVLRIGNKAIMAISNEYNHGQIEDAELSLWRLAYPDEPKLNGDEAYDRISVYLYLSYLKDNIIEIFSDTKRK